jgi:tetratricopeptide (TPR) repeat protein
MITSTALLERSWLEFEKRRTMDRALMQIQALLDQHTTKLTISQSTYKSIEESAPCQDRLFYLHCIIYPAQYELKRDLAFRYLSCQIFNSALILFKELELWDEVVTCYQLLEKPHRAELVVRERLQTEETPYMLTSLADITRDESLYERAWELSNHRFARAKRTLGKICYNRGDYAVAIGHYNQALEIQPLVPAAWYIKGIYLFI